MPTVFNPQALQDPGPAAAAGLIGSGISAGAGMLNNQANNRNAMLRQLLSTGGYLGATMLQGKQAQQLQNQKSPYLLLGAVDDINQAANDAEMRGDLTRANQLRDFGNNIVNQVLQTGSGETGATITGGGGGTPRLPATGGQPQMGASQLLPGARPTPSVSSSSGFQPVPDNTPAQQIPKGDEFALPAPTASLDTTGADVSQRIAGYSIPVQKKILENVEKSTKAVESQIKLGTVQSFDQIARAPEGANLEGLGGVQFDSVQLTPNVKSLAKLAQRRAAVNPQKFDDLGETNRNQAKVVFDIINAATQMQPAFEGKFLNRPARVAASNDTIPDFIPGGNLIEAGLQEAAISGAKDPEAFAGAVAADQTVGAELSPLLKGSFSESGNLSDGDIKRASGFVPRLGDNAKVFENKLQNFAKTTLPRIMDAAFMSGDAVVFNQAQQAYQTITGNPYKINTKDAIRGNFFKGIKGDGGGIKVEFKGGKAVQPQAKPTFQGLDDIFSGISEEEARAAAQRALQ